MGFLKFLVLLFFISCSKLTYITKQGYGQLSLELSGRDNNEVLKDKNVSIADKNKIKRIIEYKDYFYKYFDKESSAIYTETTFLKTKAVSYLVIASKFDKVDPLRVSFPIVGEFPYLGFYSLDDAKEYRDDLESEDYYTYLRPVQAYSTLDKLFFKDNILSSFFYFSDFDLAELIFHELVHTIFFIDDNVSFNESLADYIAEEMVIEYFKMSQKQFNKRIEIKNKNRSLAKHVTYLALKYQNLLKKSKPQSKKDADSILSKFLKEELTPSFTQKCLKLDVDKCWPLEMHWNNASFSAFLTYNEKKNIIKEIQAKRKMSLKELMQFLAKSLHKFEKSSYHSFPNYLKKTILK